MRRNPQNMARWLMLALVTLAMGIVTVTAGAQMPSSSDAMNAETAEPYADAPTTPAGSASHGIGFVSDENTTDGGFKVIKPGMHHVGKSKDATVLPISTGGGFIGADAAYSKPLPDGRRVWAFGDTLVGNVSGNTRSKDMRMFRNAVAVESADGDFTYFWGHGLRNDRMSGQGAFVNKRQGEWYWPGDFVVTEKAGYFFLRRMAASGSGVMGFKVTGVDLAIVHHLSTNPRHWSITYVPLELPSGQEALIPGIAATFKDGFIYLLATTEADKNHPIYVGRMWEKDLLREVYTINYFNYDTASWDMTLPPSPVLEKGAPEASLVFDNKSRQWRMVYSRGGLSRDIVMRESPEVGTGWGEETLLYTCPEATWKSDYICYAGKEVPDYPLGRAITYSVNSLKPEDLNSDLRIYVPRIIPLDGAAASAAKAERDKAAVIQEMGQQESPELTDGEVPAFGSRHSEEQQPPVDDGGYLQEPEVKVRRPDGSEVPEQSGKVIKVSPDGYLFDQ